MKNIIDTWGMGEMQVVQTPSGGLIFETRLRNENDFGMEEFKNLAEKKILSFTASVSWVKTRSGETNLYINVSSSTVERIGLDAVLKEVKEKIESHLALEHKIIRHRPV